ncbi:MAG: membrane AbrB-like protein [Paracoccaceae bacterium]|jgi:membrane AbrB-like protein
MPDRTPLSELWISARTVAIGLCGAVIGWALSVPAAVLIGPALAVTIASLLGLKTGVADWLRNTCMVALGLGIGAGFSTQAGDAILRWPLAFVVLTFMLIVTMFLCKQVLQRSFGFDPRSAMLGAVPGHLSLVLGLAAESGVDVGRIALVQTIRLLALSIVVPFAALAMGYELQAGLLPVGVPSDGVHLVGLALVGVACGLVLQRVGLPAPMLLGPLLASSIGHLTDLTPGTPPSWMMIAGFLVLGALIGSRFSGMSMARFRAALLAGLVSTLIATGVAALAAVPVAASLDMPVAHVLVAFAPGGLETMVALSAAMGASPGFVAACHIMRLLILGLLIALSLRRNRAQAKSG